MAGSAFFWCCLRELPGLEEMDFQSNDTLMDEGVMFRPDALVSFEGSFVLRYFRSIWH